MRVIRSNGDFGVKVEVIGPGPAREPLPVALARTLERPIGRGGGLRDPLPHKGLRDGYVTIAVHRNVKAWVRRQANARGLSVAAFLGLVVDGANTLSPDKLDDLLDHTASQENPDA